MKFLGSALVFGILILALVVVAQAGTAGVGGAGILADVYAGKIKTAVYQTKIFALPIKVEARAVFVQKCMDKVRVIYTRGDALGKEIPMASLTAKASLEYGSPVIVTTISPNNCVDDPTANWIKFANQDGADGDSSFFNAVERALNDWLERGQVVIPADPPRK